MIRASTSGSASVRDIIQKLEKKANPRSKKQEKKKIIKVPVLPDEDDASISDMSTDSASSLDSGNSRFALSVGVKSIKEEIEERIKNSRKESSKILPTNIPKFTRQELLPTVYRKSRESLFGEESPLYLEPLQVSVSVDQIVNVPSFIDENRTLQRDNRSLGGDRSVGGDRSYADDKSIAGSRSLAGDRTIVTNVGTVNPETMTQVFELESAFGEESPMYNPIEESPNISDYTSKAGDEENDDAISVSSRGSKDEVVSAITMNEQQFMKPNAAPLQQQQKQRKQHKQTPPTPSNSTTSPRSVSERSIVSAVATESKSATESLGNAVVKLLHNAILNNNLKSSHSNSSMNGDEGNHLAQEDEEDLEKLKNFLREVGCTQSKSNQYALILIRNGIPSLEVLTRRLSRDGYYLVTLGFDHHFAHDILELLVPDHPLLQPLPAQAAEGEQQAPLVTRSVSLADISQPSVLLQNNYTPNYSNMSTNQSVRSNHSIVSNTSAYYLNQSMFDQMMNGDYQMRRSDSIFDDGSTIRSAPSLVQNCLASETSSIYYQAVQFRNTEACHQLIALAESGDIFAQGFVMRMHALGQGPFPKDLSKASNIARKIFSTLKDIVRSKLDDHICYSAYLIGVCYSEGLSVTKNPKEAIKWYKQAAQRGYEAAQAYVGYCLYSGIGIVKNRIEAAKWYTLSASQGYAPAQTNLGICYEFGEGVPKDYSAAVKWYTLAAEQYDSTAQYNLGHCYEIGLGIQRSITKAAEYYTEASELNNAAAQHALGCLFSTGNNDIPQNLAEAYRLFKLSADQGFAESQCKLGLVYENGLGVEINMSEAVKYYRLSANQGNAAALYYLGYCYFNGIGLPQDPTIAVKLYYKSANKGYAAAQNNLGFCYFVGAGIAKNYPEALKWYRKSAEQGYPAAQFNLGYCYEKGYGVSVKLQDMLKWYRLAAAKGHPKALLKVKEWKEK